MADDLVDWADVAAVGALARAAWHLAEVEDPVRFTLEEISSSVEVDGIADEVASALREAHEAGREESRTRVEVAQEVASYLVSILPLTPAAIEIMSKELARLQDENRALRREVAALRVLLGYLRGKEDTGLFVDDYGRVGVFFTGNISCAPDDWYTSHPALAAALGLEVEE